MIFGILLRLAVAALRRAGVNVPDPGRLRRRTPPLQRLLRERQDRVGDRRRT